MYIEPQILEQRLDAGLDPLIFDVRSGFEFTTGHLPGALHMPFWKTLFGINRVAADKSSEIVLYCEHGPRAILAGRILKLHGYGNISYLKGHFCRWRREKRKLVK